MPKNKDIQNSTFKTLYPYLGCALITVFQMIRDLEEKVIE